MASSVSTMNYSSIYVLFHDEKTLVYTAGRSIYPKIFIGDITLRAS